ncbi:hypothetical protein GSF70_12375 [Flavobacteriaceae bacterium W22]|nr:hypothetical protein [Flavobacteriaceae bacterium W22]
MMRNIILVLMIMMSCKSFPQSNCSQYTILPLRTYTDIPEDQCYYRKDTQNELNDYVGTWKASWNNKSTFIYIKKITNKYDNVFKFNKDFLIIKFKTIDSNGAILFDNTLLLDEQAKIEGLNFRKADDRYGFIYQDPDLCLTSGEVRINFINPAKTQLQWNYFQDKYEIDSDCFFYNYPEDQLPRPLPGSAIFIKQ